MNFSVVLLLTGVAASAASAAGKIHAANSASSELRMSAVIKRDILKDEDVKANLKVQVHQGVVTLFGSAQSLYSKRKAVEIAGHELGVKHVVDKLKIAAGEVGAPLPTDFQIAQRLHTLYSYDSFLGPYDLTALVSHGHVRLTGTAPTGFHKQRAEELASRISGVSAVTNSVTIAKVKPSQSDAIVVRNIQDKLSHNPLTSGRRLDVKASQGVVNLTGEVRNWQEAKIASQLAYDNGAKIVRNYIVVKDLAQPVVKNSTPMPKNSAKAIVTAPALTPATPSAEATATATTIPPALAR